MTTAPCGVAMPLISYDPGDFVQGECAGRCGCALPRLQGLAGRLVDSVKLPDRRGLLPYPPPQALEGLPGLQRYQIIQEELHHFRVHCVAGSDAPSELVQRSRRSLASVIDVDSSIEAAAAARLEPPPGRTFQVAENRVRNSARVK